MLDYHVLAQIEVPSSVRKRHCCGSAAGAATLDVHAMQQAANYLVGLHDYQHFCKINFANTTTHHREILLAEVFPYPMKWKDKGDVIVLVIRGSGFLWHQVGARHMLCYRLSQLLPTRPSGVVAVFWLILSGLLKTFFVCLYRRLSIAYMNLISSF